MKCKRMLRKFNNEFSFLESVIFPTFLLLLLSQLVLSQECIVSKGNSEKQAKAIKEASKEEVQSLVASSLGLGPVDTIRAFNYAVISKDAERIKGFLSEASIETVENNARKMQTTVDALLTATNDAPMPDEREMRNQVVTETCAVVEVMNTVLGSFDNFYLIKENGNWRVDLVKIEKEVIKKTNEIPKKTQNTH